MVILGGTASEGVALSSPFWRGQNDTSYYHWTFDDNDNPAAPEVSQSINSPWGAALANITVGTLGEGWKDNFSGHSGLWDIGDNGRHVARIELDIDGLYVSTKPYVFLQVVYYQDSSIVAPFLWHLTIDKWSGPAYCPIPHASH